MNYFHIVIVSFPRPNNCMMKVDG